MSTSNIEWTDDTWNPTVGCTKVSAGCKHCYAETMHARLTAMRQPKYADPFTVVKSYPAHLDVPLRAKKPRRYFVNSMSDLFHEDVPDEYIAAVFGVMAACPQHTFQVLTKRAERMARWFAWIADQAEHLKAGAGAEPPPGVGAAAAACALLAGEQALGGPLDAEQMRGALHSAWPLPNVWLGVSVENQEQADARIPQLLKVPAAVRFLSCEPLLGPLDLRAVKWPDKGEHRVDVLRFGYWRISDRIGVTGFVNHGDMHDDFGHPIQWVIIGGESGHDARPFDLAWARSLIEQCRAAGVPVFMKQIGNVVIGFDGNQYQRSDKGGDPEGWADELRVREWPSAPR